MAMNRVFIVILFAFLAPCLAFSQTNLGDFTMRGAATIQVPGEGLTAFHPYLPLNSTAKISNPATGNQVEVTIGGRIDPSHNRIIDLTRSAASTLGIRSGDTIVLTVSAPSRRDPRERQAQLVEFTGMPIPVQQSGEPQQVIQYHSYDPHAQPLPEQRRESQQYRSSEPSNGGKSTEIYILPQPQEDDGGLSEFLAWLMAMTVDSRETREIREVREIREAREARLDRDARQMREIREMQEMKDIRDAREAREAREIRDALEARDIREAREAREIREEREERNMKIAQERRNNREPRTSKEGEAREADAVTLPASSANNTNNTNVSNGRKPPEIEPVIIQTSAGSIENQMPVNRLNMPVINLPPTFRQIESCDDSIEVDLDTLVPISVQPGASGKNSADLRVSANQTRSMRSHRQPPPVKPEALQILPALPDRHSGKAYSLQVGSFSALESANRAAALMKDVGFDVKIEYSGAVYRVMAIKISSADVYTASVRLGSLGFGQIWVRE